MNCDIKISIFASTIRPRLWTSFFKSLESTTEEYEVVFAGPINNVIIKDKTIGLVYTNKSEDHLEKYFMKENGNFTFIKTGNIKPAQCYEIARRACVGETISWSADDCEYSPDCFGKSYRYWKSLDNNKAALSIQTIEDGYRYDMKQHSYIGFNKNTPLMAPICLMSKNYMDGLGGFDKRFQCGQYENEAICRVHADGGGVLIFDEGECIIDHSKHGKEHRFRIGYTQDRKVLENSWGKTGEAVHTGRLNKFEPYEDSDLLTKSQCLTLNSIWV